MPRFMVCRYLLLFLIEHVAPALGTEHHLFDRADEVVLRDFFPVLACRENGGFVHEVCEVCSAKAGGALRNDGELHVGPERLLSCVCEQYFLAILPIRQVDDNASVETSGAQERRIKDVGAVGRCHDNDFFVRFETIHLDEYLIECLLTFIVAAADTGSAYTTYCIDLINENNRGRRFFRGLEEVSHARGADADEHLDEFGAGYREEGHACLPCHRPREQCLAGPRCAHEENALGNARAD